MATASKGDQVTKIDSVDFDQLKPNESHGRVRIAFGSATTLATGGATGDSYAMCEIPKGARTLGGFLCTGALGASIVADVGITGALEKYAADLDVAAAGQDAIGHTNALSFGAETTAKERIIVTLAGGTPAASIAMRLVMYYVLD